MLKRNLGSVAMSLAEIIIGVLLLVNPVGFTSGIIVTFGVVLMITGIGTTIKYFRTEPEEAAVSQILVKGLLMLLAGAFCAFNSHWFIAISAAISIVCGIVIITSPFSTTAILWMFIGISLIVEAVFDMIGSIFGNREKQETVDYSQEDV